jgi:hypothetical protein
MERRNATTYDQDQVDEGKHDTPDTAQESQHRTTRTSEKDISRLHIIFKDQEKPHSSKQSPTPAVSATTSKDAAESPDMIYNLHKARANDQEFPQRNKQPPLNLPPPSSKVWTSVDALLQESLDKVFTASFIENNTPQHLIAALNDFLYRVLEGQFGTKEAPASAKPKSKRRSNKALERLRQKKKECRRAYRKLLKSGASVNDEAVLTLKRKYQQLLRKHNRLRVALHKKAQAKASIDATKKFKKNPQQYAKNLFKGTSSSHPPTFSKETAEKYFKKTYHDVGRGHEFQPMEGMKRPAAPEWLFDISRPTLQDYQKITKKKRNKASPGFNNIGYVPYKKCPSILKVHTKISDKIWKTKSVPDEWAAAFVIMLSKSEIYDLPVEFRPIALTNCDGKIFFSVISNRFQTYLVKNKYIKRNKQKGFLAGVPGCTEHAFTLSEALNDAKRNQRQIVTTWIDLANAYGSVRHNLIQFALNWYHVPKIIQDILFDYYEKICACVIANDWTTGSFLFDIGLFQGCVLSSILFDAVFNLLLDMLEKDADLGYTFKDRAVSLLDQAYADDLSLSSSTPEKNQQALDTTDRWLLWTETMKAKPKKCVSLAAKKFDKRLKDKTYTPFFPIVYSPFDPKLTIKGERIRFIVDRNQPDTFKREHFKFLGRNIHVKLSEEGVKTKVEKDLRSNLQKCNDDPVNDICKLWLYQHYIVNYLSWPFFTHDFAHSFAKDLQPSVNVFLRRWAGLYKSSDAGSLYRSNDYFGLNLTSITRHFEHMQMVKCHLLKYSDDEDVCTLYRSRETREANFKNWRATKFLTECEAKATHDHKFKGQTTRQGLGAGNYKQELSRAEQRKLTTTAPRQLEEERLIARAYSHERQSAWTSWHGKAMPFDLSWKNLIWGHCDRHLIKFVLNATINCNKTPAMLKLFGYIPHANCPLKCGNSKCTLHHIISNCSKALSGKRYTWRHDSVLLTQQKCLEEHIETTNSNNKETPPQPPKSVKPLYSYFLKSGEKPQKQTVPTTSASKSLLRTASDWKIIIDFNGSMVFPPEICTTPLRPDIVIWSTSSNTVIMAELTCPAEEGITAASIRKKARYAELVETIKSKGWTVHLFTVEAGARGFVAHSFNIFFRKIGMSPSTAKSLCKAISHTVARCSLHIYYARENATWRAPDLLNGDPAE